MSEGPISDTDLLAFADGRLEASRHASVEAFLLTHPERAADVELWKRQNEAIAGLFDPIAGERVPDRLTPRRIAARIARPRAFWPGMAIAAVVLLTLGVGGGWFLRDIVSPAETPSELLVEGAVAAHALYVTENRHAVEVAASDRQHLISWLSNRIETPIDAPDLTAEGFSLVGGRLLPATLYTVDGPAAQLMYENAGAERITVYVTGALSDSANAYEFVEAKGLDAFYWSNARITCTVVGDLPEAEMKSIARKIYQQLTRRPDGTVEGG